MFKLFEILKDWLDVFKNYKNTENVWKLFFRHHC